MRPSGSGGPQLWRVLSSTRPAIIQGVRALVYIAAFALDEGESCATIEQALPQASKAFKTDSNGNWWIEPEHFAADFAADIPKDKAAFMAYLAGADLSPTRLRTLPRRLPGRPSPLGTWWPRWTDSINPEQERMMAKRANAKTVEVNASHVAYISHPEETARLIAEAAHATLNR